MRRKIDPQEKREMWASLVRRAVAKWRTDRTLDSAKGVVFWASLAAHEAPEVLNGNV